MKFTLFIIMNVFLLSCDNSNKSNIDSKINSNIKHEIEPQKCSDTCFITTNNFTHKYEIDSMNFNAYINKGAKIILKKNVYNEYTHFTDTLFKIKLNKSEFTFLKLNDRIDFINCELKDSNFTIGGVLKVGINKYEVFNSLKINKKFQNCSVINLCDEETESITLIKFNRNVVENILTNWYYE